MSLNLPFGRALYTIYRFLQQSKSLKYMTILYKSAAEIEKMRVVGRLAAEVLEMIAPFVKAGVTTAELDRICHDFIVHEQKAIPAPLKYHGFPKSICTSVNSCICHGIPSVDKQLKEGDIINLDITVKLKPEQGSFHGDTSQMFMIGHVKPRTANLVKVAQECLYKGIALVKPGVRLGDIGHVIQSHAQKSKFSVVREYCGHGIGRSFHEEPKVLHYGKPQTGITLKEGMTFTIEPMINAGKPKIKLLADGWTVRTADRKPSAQWEHTLLVTPDGVEVLTLREDESFSY